MTRIAKNALPEGYSWRELVAPVWTPQQAQNIVWPSEKSGVREMKFSTFDFFLAVRTELAKAHKLDPRYSFSLTWSSSGMSGYGFSLLPKSGITGTFVAMSVFQPAMLPPLSAAKGHPYFIYHSTAGLHSHRATRSGRATLSKRLEPLSSFRLTRVATDGEATSSATFARESIGSNNKPRKGTPK